MVQHPIIKDIRKRFGISQEAEEDIERLFQYKTYQRNEYLLQEGQQVHELYYILKGVVHQYFTQANGKERTCSLVLKDSFVTDLEGFKDKTTASTNLQCLKDVECLSILCSDLSDLMDHYPEVAAYFRYVVEENASENIARVKSLLEDNPEQMYVRLIQSKPELLQEVPMKYIAQFLGIAPESLSRIKKRILEKEKP